MSAVTENSPYRPTVFESIASSLPLPIRTSFVLTVTAMCAGDWYVHPTLGKSLPQHRRLLKNFLDNFMRGGDARDIVSHIGNCFLSAAPAIGIVILGEVCRYLGEKHDNKTLIKLARWSPAIALATTCSLNLGEELQQMSVDPQESLGDIEYGMASAVLATTAATGTFASIRNQRSVRINHGSADLEAR